MFCYSPLRKHGYVIKISILKPTGGEGGNLGHQIILQYQKPCKYAFHGKHSNNMNANSWILSFRFRKSFFCEQILPTCHWNTPPKSFLIPTNTREREMEREGERKTWEDKINRAYSPTILCHCDPSCISISSKAVHSFKVTFQHCASF